MVARGDLGVELGFERMAEVQEQILWLCEAVLVSVIWATQVPGGGGEDRHPRVRRITDAAMRARAELSASTRSRGPHGHGVRPTQATG